MHVLYRSNVKSQVEMLFSLKSYMLYIWIENIAISNNDFELK